MRFLIGAFEREILGLEKRHFADCVVEISEDEILQIIGGLMEIIKRAKSPLAIRRLNTKVEYWVFALATVREREEGKKRP